MQRSRAISDSAKEGAFLWWHCTPKAPVFTKVHAKKAQKTFRELSVFEIGSHYIVQAGIELTLYSASWSQTHGNPSALASLVLRLQVCLTTPSVIQGTSARKGASGTG